MKYRHYSLEASSVDIITTPTFPFVDVLTILPDVDIASAHLPCVDSVPADPYGVDKSKPLMNGKHN